MGELTARDDDIIRVPDFSILELDQIWIANAFIEKFGGFNIA